MSKLSRSLQAIAVKTGALFMRLAASAVVWLLAFGLLGLGSIVAGVAVLCGLGFALIAGGVAFLVVAAFIKRGLANG